jgi:hypothetical protein
MFAVISLHNCLAAQSSRNPRAIAVQSLYVPQNRCAIVVQSLRIHYEIAAQHLKAM